MRYDAFFQFASSVPSWSKQHPGLHVEVDRECQDFQLTMNILQTKQLLHSDLEQFETQKFQMAVQDLFATHWNLHPESQLMPILRYYHYTHLSTRLFDGFNLNNRNAVVCGHSQLTESTVIEFYFHLHNRDQGDKFSVNLRPNGDLRCCHKSFYI